MNLFITNKDYFTEFFDNQDRFINSNLRNYTSKEIHKKAFTELSISIDVKHSIPVTLTPSYSENGNGIVVFDFKAKKGDIYYYEFATTAS